MGKEKKNSSEENSPEEILTKGKFKENLEALKKFYKEVWGSYSEYVENDRALYEVFSNKEFTTQTRITILNKMYSAGMRDLQIYSFKKFIDEGKLTKDDLRKDGTANEHKAKLKNGDEKAGYEYTDKNGKEDARRLTSLKSKYLHWEHEVNKKSDFVAIFDRNVKNQLLPVQYTNSKTYEKIEKAVNDFIEQCLGKNSTKDKKIDLENEYQVAHLPSSISIYRLVDKFLWLKDKLEKIGDGQSSNVEELKKLKNGQYDRWKIEYEKQIKAQE